MADVFVSYSRKDQAFVRRLHDALRRYDQDSWVDWEGIAPTAPWMLEIERAIESADTFVFVLSPHSVASQICHREVAHAVAHHKRLVPVVVDDVAGRDVPESLAQLNWIFFRSDDDFDRAVETLMEAIRTDLDWVRAHTRMLVRAREWEAGQREPSLVLRGEDLARAEGWLARGAEMKPAPTRLQVEYVTHSRRAATKRQRRMLGAVTAALVVTLILAVATWIQWRSAVRGERIRAAHGLATRAGLLSQQRGEHLPRSALLAVESMRRLDALGTVALDADRVLRDALALLPRPRGRFEIGGPLAVVALSPEARYLAAEPAQEPLKIWDTATGRQTADLETASAYLAAFSADERFLATADRNAAVRVFKVPDGELVAEIRPESAEVAALAVSPDGHLLATVSPQGRLALWRTEEPATPLHETELTDLSIGRVVAGFHPDGGSLAVAIRDFVVAYDTRTWQQTLREEMGGAVTVAGFSPRGTYLAVGTAMGDLQLWNVEGGSMIPAPGLARKHVSAIAFSLDEQSMAVAVESEALIWDVANGRERGRIAHEGRIVRLVFDPAGRYLASASDDATARVWDAASGREMTRMSHGASVPELAFDPDGQRVVSVDVEGKVRLWEAVADPSVAGIELDAGVGHLAFTPEGHSVLVISPQGEMYVWDRGTESSKAMGDPRATSALLSAGNERIAFSRGESAEVWDLGSLRRIAELPHDGEIDWEAIRQREEVERGRSYREAGPWLKERRRRGSVRVAAFRLDGRYLVTTRIDEVARIWDVETAREIARVPYAGLLQAAFSTDGRFLALCQEASYRGGESASRFFELDSGREVSASRVAASRFLGPSVLSYDILSERVRVWGVDADSQLQVLEGNREAVVADGLGRALAFKTQRPGVDGDLLRIEDLEGGREIALLAPGYGVGQFLLSGSDVVTTSTTGMILSLWQLPEAEEMARIHMSEPVSALALSPRGDSVVVASGKTVSMLALRGEGLIAEACARLGRDLTPEEWRQEIGEEEYVPTCGWSRPRPRASGSAS